jgi:hypothetical protein
VLALGCWLASGCWLEYWWASGYRSLAESGCRSAATKRGGAYHSFHGTYEREYKRLKRAGICQTPGQTLIPMPFRLKTAHDVLALLAEQVEAVRDEQAADTLEKARAIGYLAGVALRAIESGDPAGRLEALEGILKRRRAG